MAAGEGYEIPLSIDISGVDQALSKTIESAKAVQNQAKETGESFKKMNDQIVAGTAASTEKINEQMQATLVAKKTAEDRAKAERIMIQVFDEVAKKQNENIKLSDQQSKVVAEYARGLDYAKKALASATDPTQIKVFAKDMEILRDKIVAVYDRASKAVTPMNSKLQESGELVDKLSDSIMGAFSPEELNQLGSSINGANNELDQLGVLIDFISSKMEGMDPSSELFKQLSADIETANQMLGRTTEVVDISTLSWDQLTDRLKFFQDSLKGETNPQEIIRINQEISNTEEQLKRIKNAGKEGFDELGNRIVPELEDKVKSLNTQLEETIQQLARMRIEGQVDTAEYDALLDKATEIKQAITAVNDELKKTSSNTQGLDTLIESASLVAAGFNVAQGTMALFGAESEDLEKVTAKLAAGIAVLQGLQEIQVQLKNRESVANKVLTATQALYTTVVGTSTGALKIFRIALAATGIGLIIIALGYLIANWDRLTSSIKMSGPEAEKWGQRFDKIKAIAMGVGNAIFQWMITPIKVLYTLLTEGAGAAIDAFVDSMNVVKNYNEGFNFEIQRQNDAAHREKLEAQKIALEKEIELRKAAGQKVIEQERALHSTLLALTKAGSEEQMEALHDFKVWEAKTNKEMEDERKRAADKRKQEMDKAAREREKELQRIKDFNRKLIDLEYERQETLTRQLEESAEKSKELESIRYQQELESFKRQLEDFKGTEEEKNRLKSSLDKISEQLAEEHIAKLWAIDVDYFNNLATAQSDSNKLLLQINKQDQDLELAELDDKYKKITEQYKDAFGVEKDFTEEKNREIASVNAKYALKDLKDQEDIELAKVDLIKVAGKGQEKQARLREMIRLQVTLDAAQKRLEILKAIGGEENAVAIAQTEALISTLSEQIEEKAKEGGKKNIFQLLGIDMSDEDAQLIVDSYKQVFSQIAQAFEESLNLQIQAKQKQIDTLTKQISDVEKELDKEIEAQKKGYASNVEGKKAELDALQVQRDKEIAQQEELQKRQQKLAIAQIALNGAVQASQLGLAAAKIFEAHSGIPFVGVALAAAAGLSMLATMMSIKNQIKAMKAESVPSYRKGGVHLLNGPSHEQGGLGVYNEKTGKRIAEVEGNEGFFAITARNKHLIPLFQQLNDEGVSVHKNAQVDKGDMNNVVVLAQKHQATGGTHGQDVDNDALRDIANTNKAMLDNERNKEERIDMGDHWIVNIGVNHKRIIWKKKA
ncbi:hypothetical protein FAZ19_16280 [Sphingobacterium alkalisoli]|uniref:Uncharacterized protein n=1 Tax=Sphingobacterium alkalisoli TaxID=1874115 RepID=A0A4U0GYN3_9SPHI|nr:hypothetical protein [Sphingobacterium alkalisoli]TJY63824.1 hypothetical protein FAZ19_16280 [Sphingobacterium alkalisoli]GGH24642.1 hypothetical protein GCM10011418_32700 [Sphingobacterium alkalisoli]